MPEAPAIAAANETELTPRAIRRAILVLAWPTVLQALLRTGLFFADTYMLSRYDASGRALAAVTLVGPLAHTLAMVLAALGTGTVATVARATGARDRALQEQETATSLAVAALGGVLLLVAALPLFPLLTGIFSVPDHPTAGAEGAAFLKWFVLAIPFLMLDASASGALRAAGDSRTPFFVALLANVLNVFGNWVFIFGNLGAPEMGVEGAGLSTAIAFTVQGLLVSGWLFMRKAAVPLRASSFRRITRASAARVIRVSVPAAIEPILLQAGFIVFIWMMGHLGKDALAAHRVAVTIESLAFMPGWGLAIATGAIVGQYLGAQRPDRAEEGLRQSALIALIAMTALGVVFAAAATPLSRHFLQDAAAASAAAWCLRIAAVEQIFMALAMVLGGALRGAGDTRSPVLVGLLGVWLIRVPLSYLIAVKAGLGIPGAWLVMIVDWAARAAAFYYFWRRGRWKTLRL